MSISPTNASAWSALSHLHYQKPDFTEAKLAAQRAYEEDVYLSAAPDIVWRLYSTMGDAARRIADGGRRGDRAGLCRRQDPAVAARGQHPLRPPAGISRLDGQDPEGELLGTEAFVRVLLGDTDEAFRLLKPYFTIVPVRCDRPQ